MNKVYKINYSNIGPREMPKFTVVNILFSAEVVDHIAIQMSTSRGLNRSVSVLYPPSL